MIFEHSDTGLKVVVHEKKETIEFETEDGRTGSVDNRKDLVTECDQRCFPATQDDFHDLRQVDVFTNTGKVAAHSRGLSPHNAAVPMFGFCQCHRHSHKINFSND